MLKFIHWKFLKIFCPGVRKRIFNNVNMQWNLLGWHPFELKWNRKTSKIFWGYWALEQEECICRENNKEEFILLGSILKRSYWARQRSQNLNKSSGLFFRLLCPSFCSVCPQIVEHVDWMEEKQQITSCSKQIPLHSCQRFMQRHYTNSIYFEHQPCANFYVSQSHLCYFV